MSSDNFNSNFDSNKVIPDELNISSNVVFKKFQESTNTQLNLNWESKIIHAHSGGIGGIIIPEIYINELFIEEFYEITFPLNNQESFSKLLKLVKVKNKYLFYLPKELEYLIGKNVSIHLLYDNFIPVKFGANYHITLPVSLIDKFQLQDHDICEIEVIFNKHSFNKIVMINRKDRSKEREKRQMNEHDYKDSYYITFPYENIQQGTEGKLRLVRKLESLIYQKNENDSVLYMPNIYSNENNEFFIGKINENEIIVLAERTLPVHFPLYLQIDNEVIYYFGCYLADGSTHGDSTAINASTYKQANYFMKMYRSFIYNTSLLFYLSYTKLATDLRENQDIISELKLYWQNIPDIVFDDNKIRLWTSRLTSRENKKMTEYGTLEINDARKIVKIFYIKLMEKITTLLLKSKSKVLIWKFILGFLEGDGSVHISNTGRFYIKFAANIDNIEILTNLLDIIEVRYRLDKSQIKNGGKGVMIIIFIQQILKHLDNFSSEIFKYYPKRRKLFVIRFFMNPSVHYLTGYRNKLNQPSVEKYLNENIKNSVSLINEIYKLEHELNSYGFKIADFVNEFNKYGKYISKKVYN